jgi:hypothetical protein
MPRCPKLWLALLLALIAAPHLAAQEDREKQMPAPRVELKVQLGHSNAISSVAFSPDGRWALTGSWDKTARLWEVATGRELRRFEGHSDVVVSVAFSPDGRWSLTGGRDGTTRYFDVATGGLLATTVSFRDGGWAVVDPEGRFDTNDLDGGASLHWIASDDPLRPLPLEIFMRDYYTPRLLTRILNGEELPPIRAIAEIKNRVQPDVAVVSVTGSKAHPGRADIIVHAASHTDEKGQASGLQDLRLFRNGQMVGYLEKLYLAWGSGVARSELLWQ